MECYCSFVIVIKDGYGHDNEPVVLKDRIFAWADNLASAITKLQEIAQSKYNPEFMSGKPEITIPKISVVSH